MTLTVEPSVLAALALLGAGGWLALSPEFLARVRAGAARDALGLATLSGLLVERGARLWRQGQRRRDAAPVRLGDYELGERIGQGAMGQVYRARHVPSGAWRAVKVLPRGASPRARQRFAEEAALGARSVRHDGIVAIHERGEARDGSAFYAMELIEGSSLQQIVEREGALSLARASAVAQQLCAALAHLHGQGLVHRDVKPDNVLVYRTADGAERVKLIDLGLVRRAGRASERGSGVVGTPLYLSPEAITAPELVGARSDLYALGAVVFFMLSGAPVFQGHSAVDVCCQHLYSEPPSLSAAAGAAISEELERTVLACLAKDPAARPASALELAARLARGASSDAHEAARAARVARLVPERMAPQCAAAA
jgi:eukaryotic-like serine/threonine-protein kinase